MNFVETENERKMLVILFIQGRWNSLDSNFNLIGDQQHETRHRVKDSRFFFDVVLTYLFLVAFSSVF